MLTAQVYEGNTFRLNVFRYRLTGTVDADGRLHAAGDADGRPVAFSGHIARPIFGQLFSGKITDGRCDPYIELVPGTPG